MSPAYSVPRGRLAGLRSGKQLYSRIIEGCPELRIFDRREGDCFTLIKTRKSSINLVFSCHDRGRIQDFQANASYVPDLGRCRCWQHKLDEDVRGNLLFAVRMRTASRGLSFRCRP
jgi:hypothetical protein